ncbi:hypothetical protein [Novipirellula sp.]|uniref:hypothetical protein n=1 Tax=Novipirellula sp. TaxID=2795430 RepID=UPI00356883E1
MRYFICLAFVTACCSIPNVVLSQDAAESSLNQRIETLELKLQLAEQQIKQLNEECEALRKENASLKEVEAESSDPAKDQFAPGVVWGGLSKIPGQKDELRWAISIAQRDGDKLEGVVATHSPSGDKIEFPVTGKAPRRGDGLVIIESPVVGRAKIFMRGTLRNGSVALAFSGTSPLGKKFFGSAALSPKN